MLHANTTLAGASDVVDTVKIVENVNASIWQQHPEAVEHV